MGNICGMMASWFLGEKGGADGIGTGNWTQEENKLFEHAVAKRRFDKDTPDRWEKVAAYIPGKAVRDVVSHYRDSLDYVSEMEAGWVPCPGHDSSLSMQPPCVGGKRAASDQERKKRVPWTDEEHWYRVTMEVCVAFAGDFCLVSKNMGRGIGEIFLGIW
ncbi:transcription factor DIVARICATA-like isoform X2 [Musa acuminata AAA Group]|uniref:transcription factor DIVARICATA-like isoform X2 n=1 Tax=Musa acuminata AAA Group TaxID=214697 RepID=UPI0031D36119